MDVFTSMRNYLPMTIARSILKACELPVKRGWDEIITEIEQIPRDEDYSRKVNECTQYYTETLMYLNKAIYVYEIPEDQTADLLSNLTNIAPEASFFHNNFPYFLSQEDLNQTPLNETFLTKIHRDDDGLSLIYCSKSFIEIRETISSETLENEVNVAIGSPDEIITIKKKSIQLFHVIWISHCGKKIHVRVGNHKQLPAERVRAIHDSLVVKFNRAAGIPSLPSPVNVFPAIERLYKTAREGTVVSMDFSTQTGSVKSEKMRKSGLDLRTELFHRGGCSAVNNAINPYKITVRWEKDHSGYKVLPEASLNSSFAMTGTVAPTLYEFHINNAHCADNYNFVISKIIA